MIAHSFPFRTEPFAHQAAEFFNHRDTPARALWWDPGCAKTKPIIDTSAYLWREGAIGGVFILAPETVHAQWCLDQYPAHLPDFCRADARRFVWSTQKSTGKRWMGKFKRFLEYKDGLTILSMTYSALMTERGAKAAKAFMTSRPCMEVLDESHRIKGSGTGRTKRVLSTGWTKQREPKVPFRRILTGTPISNAPFDAYTQCKFLKWDVWHDMDIGGSVDFRAHFGEWRQRFSRKDGRFFPELVRYRNLPQLRQVALSLGSRYLKKDVLDLPPQLYEKAYFKPAPAQMRMYSDLVTEYRAWFGDGSTVTADLAIVRRGRLQQILSGYVPADREDELRPIIPPEKNPRLKALADVLGNLPEQAVLWGKYDVDVDGMAAWCRRIDTTYVTYDGRTSTSDRLEARDRFMRGDAQFFIGKASAAGVGLDGLQKAASEAVFFNNSDSLDDRVQAENRIHRPGMSDRSATYFDLVALIDESESVDQLILKNLRAKFDVAACCMGDELHGWI